MRTLRLRGSGAGASAVAIPDLATATTDDLAALFAELDVRTKGVLPVDQLVSEAKSYFDTRPTSQPVHWIRTMITKFDDDCDGMLDQEQFLHAVAALRRC